MNPILITILVIILLSLIFVIYVYNKILRLKTLKDEAWSGIDVQLKLRYDLIPKLVSIVKEYARFETNLLTEVTELRSKAMSQDSIEQKSNLEHKISDTISNIFVSVESYPEIKSNENFIKLQDNLVKVEEDIQLSRRYYNGAVRNFNIAINTFPNNIISNIFGYRDALFFEADEDARSDVKVNLN